MRAIKLIVECDGQKDLEIPREKISSLLDQEIEDFSNFMATIGDWRAVGPLSPPERALIKTYLVQKLTGKIDGTPAGSTNQV